MPVIPAIQEAETKGITVRSQPRKIVLETLSQTYSTQKRTGSVAQAIEGLSSKCEVLNSNSSTNNKKGLFTL
jgi:hypothetical protein